VDFEKGIDSVFKLLNTVDITKLLKKTHDLFFMRLSCNSSNFN